MNIKKFLVSAAAGALMLGATAVPVFAVGCTPTGFFRDGINMTAALVNPGDITGEVDASGCNVGVYYGPGSTGTVDAADVHGANYYGIVVQQAAVDVTNSSVYNIGETPFNGSQHGVGIYYANVAGVSNGDCTDTGSTSGTVDSNTVSSYQKGGVVVACSQTNASVTNNTVTGLGPVDFIAQNGIQVSSGAGGVVRGNSVSGNFYTGTVGVGPNSGGQNPPGWQYTSGVILLYRAGDVQVAQNKFSGNQRNMEMVP